MLLAILAVSPLLATNYFDGDWVMVLCLMVAFTAYAPAIIARGICSGTGRFNSYALVMGSDGVVRIILCIALAVIGVKSAGAFGFAVALAPLVGLGIVWSRGALRTADGPEAPWSEVTPNLGWLLLGSVFAAMLLNAGPIATTILADPDQKTEVTAFAYGVLMARIPLFLFQAVQAALLPRLSRLAARNELGEFRAGLKRLLMVVLAVGRRRHDRGARARAVRDQDLLRRRAHRQDAGDAGARQRLLHGRHLAGPGRHRPQGPRLRGDGLGRRRRRVPARHVAVERRRSSSGWRSGCWRRRSRRW